MNKLDLGNNKLDLSSVDEEILKKAVTVYTNSLAGGSKNSDFDVLFYLLKDYKTLADEALKLSIHQKSYEVLEELSEDKSYLTAKESNGDSIKDVVHKIIKKMNECL